MSIVSLIPVDLARSVSDFLSDQYMNTAGINRKWREAYHGLPCTTRGVDNYTTVEQFKSHLSMGYGKRPPSRGNVYRPPSRNSNGEIPCAKAASLGRTDLLQAAYESSLARRDVTACTSAAAGGHLETIKYLHFMECPWDESTANAAAEGGHLDILQWIIPRGCPSNNLTQLSAASRGDLEMVSWLYFHGHPVCSSVIEETVLSGYSHIVEWARSLGIEYSSAFTAAIKSGNMDMVVYMHERMYSWHRDDVIYRIQLGGVSPRLTEWLVSHGYVDCTQ